MKILVTGFNPFGEEKINPAFEIIKRLKNIIAGADVVKLEVPTVFEKCIEVAAREIEKEKPNYVLCIGQAGGRFGVTVERVAINVNDARIEDNEGKKPIDTPIDIEGESAYFATIPIKEIVSAIKKEKIPAAISDSAGTFVCNHLMYGVLNHISKNNIHIKAGFIHIPFLTEQAVDKPNMPSMSIDTMLKAIETAIATIILYDRN